MPNDQEVERLLGIIRELSRMMPFDQWMESVEERCGPLPPRRTTSEEENLRHFYHDTWEIHAQMEKVYAEIARGPFAPNGWSHALIDAMVHHMAGMIRNRYGGGPKACHALSVRSTLLVAEEVKDAALRHLKPETAELLDEQIARLQHLQALLERWHAETQAARPRPLGMATQRR